MSQDDVMKQKDELVNEIVSLKVEIQQVKDDRDRHITEIETLQAEATKQNDFKDTINELEVFLDAFLYSLLKNLYGDYCFLR